MSTTVRVAGFTPTVNGLHFTNDWPPGTPDYVINIAGVNITIGDAHNGLCGGMAYTVADVFHAGYLPPPDKTPPAAQSAFFNYIVSRLTNSFDWDDVNQYLSWIQMSNHDTTLGGHGLAWHEIMEEWPKIKADLDGNSLSALGLVHGQEPSTVGFFTGVQDLHGCHQVIAWGYDLDGTSLTIHVYDPDYMGDNYTITLDIGNPKHTTPIAVTPWSAGTYRGFFKTHYQFHDPTTAVSGSFVGVGVVSSPGLTGLARITPPAQANSAIAGNVSDPQGKPIVGASVTVRNTSATTDSHGNYQLSNVPPEIQQVWASAVGYITSTQSITVLGGQTMTANFHLNWSGRIIGTVTDTTGRLIPGATVAVSYGVSTRTDAQGQYSIIIGPGFYLVDATASFCSDSASDVNVTAGATTTQNFTLAKLGTVSGKVTDSGGKPIPGASVIVGNKVSITGLDGSYIVNNYPDTYDVSVNAWGYQGSSANVTMPAGGGTIAKDFSLVKAVPGTITGHVTDSRGKPISGAQVLVGPQWTDTDSTGRYTISNIPSGSHDVTANADAFNTSTISATVIAGQSITVDFKLEVIKMIKYPRPKPIPGPTPM